MGDDSTKPEQKPVASDDDRAAREARAKRLRGKIDEIVKGAKVPAPEKKPRESAREFVQRRMRELEEQERRERQADQDETED